MLETHRNYCTEPTNDAFNSACSTYYYVCEDVTCPEENRHSSYEGETGTPSNQGGTLPVMASMHPCDVHVLSVVGDHSYTTPPCGVAAHATYACQIGSSHKDTVTCPQENGQDCIYGSYYPCVSFGRQHTELFKLYGWVFKLPGDLCSGTCL